MKKSILNTSAFRYIFEIIVIVFSVTLSFYIQDVLNDREKLELKNISLRGVLSDLEKDIINFNYAVDLGRKRISNIDTILNPKYDLSSKIVNTGAKRYFGFLGNNSNYKSMVSSGALEFIADSNHKSLFVFISSIILPFINILLTFLLPLPLTFAVLLFN